MHDWTGMRKLSVMFALCLIVIGSPVRAGTEVELKSKAAKITLTGRVHTQFNTSSVDRQIGSEFLIRRARITAEVKLNDYVSGKVQPDYGSGKISLKDAYMKLRQAANLSIKIGQFKRPFDLFELTSSTKILVIERGGKIRGASVVSYSTLSEGLGYADRDIGVEADLKSPGGRFSLAVAVTNGTGPNKVPSETDDAIGEKQFTARSRIKPVVGTDITFALGATLRPHTLPGTAITKSGATVDLDVAYSPAVEFSVEYGDFKRGPHMQAGILRGANWEANRADPPGFVAAQWIGTYKKPLDGEYVQAVEPLVRVSYADPDTETENDGGILVTPGVQFFFVGRNKIAVNVDVFIPDDDGKDTDYAVRAQSFVHF